jgi:hypothetical protein
MKMVGHKTQAIYSRYAIADDGMLKDAAENLERLHAIDHSEQPTPSRRERVNLRTDKVLTEPDGKYGA